MPYVTVLVDMEDFSDDDIADEFESRNIAISPAAVEVDENHPLRAIYQALKLGRESDALNLTKAFVCDTMGVVL